MLQGKTLKLLAALLLTSACAPMGAKWTEVQSPKQASADLSTESFVVKLAKGGHALLPGEKQQLDQYLAHLGHLETVEFSLRRTHKGISVGALAPVESELVERGADPHKIVRLAEIGFDYQGQWADVEIIAKRYVAVAPTCPDWSRPDIIGKENMGSSNFGCATAASLALSVADPRDLVRGREQAPASGTTAVGAVDRYNTDKVKDLLGESTRKAE